jgi:hypothetical protein
VARTGIIAPCRQYVPSLYRMLTAQQWKHLQDQEFCSKLHLSSIFKDMRGYPRRRSFYDTNRTILTAIVKKERYFLFSGLSAEKRKFFFFQLHFTVVYLIIFGIVNRTYFTVRFSEFHKRNFSTDNNNNFANMILMQI